MENDFFKNIDSVRNKHYEKITQTEIEEHFKDSSFLSEIVFPVIESIFNGYNYDTKENKGFFSRWFDDCHEIVYALNFTNGEIQLENYTAGKATISYPIEYKFYLYETNEPQKHFKSLLESLFIELANRGY